MRISVGTFNLNNLFSRWNFAGAIDEIADGGMGAVTVRYEFTDPSTYRIRTFRGRLVREKRPVDTERLAERIVRIGVDVLTVQEVENIATLREFNATHLGSLYPHVALVEGNDARFIDVGVLSKYPLGPITSHQTRIHPDQPDERVFSRDLLEVDVLNAARRRRLFTVYVNHLKSRFVPFPQDPVDGRRLANARRRRQAETIAEVVATRQRPDGRFLVLGDMNDDPDAAPLRPLRIVEGQRLVDGLANPVETRPPPADRSGPGPSSPRWTHRFKPTGEPAVYELLDQIWLSPSLGRRQTGGFIDRRIRLTGDGTDHDGAWVELEL